MSNSPIDRQKSIVMLCNSIRAGQKMGAYLLREAYILKKAMDYLDPNVPADKKPTYEDSDNPEATAINLLLQGVQKAQAHGGEHAYQVEDACTLWEIIEFWMKESGKSVANKLNTESSSTPKEKHGRSSKSAAAAKQSISKDESDEEDDGLISVATPKAKAK